MAGGDEGDGLAEDGVRGVSEGVRQAVKLTSGRVHLLTRQITNSHVDVGARACLDLDLGWLVERRRRLAESWSSVGSDQVRVHYWR